MLGKLLATEVNNYESITFLGNEYAVEKSFTFLQSIFNIISFALIPLFIAVAAGGAIYAIVLGVNLARAADAESRDAAKKRLIWAIVGLASIVVIIILLNWLVPKIPEWVSSYQEGDIWTASDGTYKWTKDGADSYKWVKQG